MKPEQNITPINEEEKLILDLLKKDNPTALNTLKDKSGLSNKKWDKSLKSLTRSKFVKKSSKMIKGFG